MYREDNINIDKIVPDFDVRTTKALANKNAICILRTSDELSRSNCQEKMDHKQSF